MIRFFKIIITVLTLYSVSGNVTASGTDILFSGVVIQVTDGDTAKVRGSNGQTKDIRFFGVDSPEKEWPGRWPDQPFCHEASKFMSDLILNKVVMVRLNGDSTYSRDVGELFIDGKSASKELVRAGLGWWNKKYAPNYSELKKLENEARARKIGLWSTPNPEAPWHYRRRHPAL